MAALRQAGLVETTRGRGGGTVVTTQAADAVGPRRGAPTAAQRADWLDALVFRRIVEPGAAPPRGARDARRRAPGPSSTQAHEAVADARSRPSTGRPTPGST